MKNRLATLALAALPALVLSACNGSTAGSGVSAIPNGATAPQSKIHPNKKVGAALYGGGATFPAYGYNLGAQPVGTPGPGQPTPAPGSILFGAQTKTKGAIYYCLTGSGFGRKEFEANNG